MLLGPKPQESFEKGARAPRAQKGGTKKFLNFKILRLSKVLKKINL